LKQGLRKARDVFDVSESSRKKEGDLELNQVGRDARMPWQSDGRGWHTTDRVSHTGKPCRWEGVALEHVIDVIDASEKFAPVNWNNRSVVEMMGKQKTGGWFLHAMTADEWLLTFKFRVKKNTFQQDELQSQLALKPLDQIDELPVYGRTNRVRVKNKKGPWQEVSIAVHWLKEIESPAFAKFLNQARKSYLGEVEKPNLDLKELTPWKILGRKWHLSRKGFPSGKRVAWKAETLDTLFDVLENLLPNGEIDWGNKQVVYFRPQGKPHVWAAVNTKRRGGIDLSLFGKPGQFALGRIAEFGIERDIVSHRDGREAVKIRFTKMNQIKAKAFRTFLQEHLATQ
jgi:excinuclease ABC subunit A